MSRPTQGSIPLQNPEEIESQNAGTGAQSFRRKEGSLTLGM